MEVTRLGPRVGGPGREGGLEWEDWGAEVLSVGARARLAFWGVGLRIPEHCTAALLLTHTTHTSR